MVAPAGGSARSTTQTRAPACAARQALARPMTPPPTNTASKLGCAASRSLPLPPPALPGSGQTVGGLDATLSARQGSRSRVARAPVRPPMLPAAARAGHNRAVSFAPPEGQGPLRRERLRTARLYFVCDARPGGADPEPLLRAALGGGVDIVQLREKQLGRAEIERAASTFRRMADNYSALFIVNDDPDLARICDADGVHVGQDDASVDEARAMLGPQRDHRPVDPLRGADRRGRGARRRLLRGRAGLGDADQTGAAGGRAGAGHPRGRGRDETVLRDRRDQPAERRPGRRRGGAAALRGAGDPRRSPPRSRRRSAAARLRGRGVAPGRGAGWLSRASASERSRAARRRHGAERRRRVPPPHPARADGSGLRQGRGPQPGGARGAGAARRGRAAAGGHGRRDPRRPRRDLDRRHLRRRGEGERRGPEARHRPRPGPDHGRPRLGDVAGALLGGRSASRSCSSSSSSPPSTGCW